MRLRAQTAVTVTLLEWETKKYTSKIQKKKQKE